MLSNGKVRGKIVRAEFDTRHSGVCVEVDPTSLLRAVAKAIAQLGASAKRADYVALSVMSPAWVAMDAKGKPLTPIITHQDRRSVQISIELERRVGKDRHLQLAGNRPVPGGISSTTWAWFLQNQPALMRKANLVGHLNTFLHRQFTDARVIDPSNASFMGLYNTLDQSGWNQELIEAVGADLSLLPQVLEANQIGGNVTRDAGRVFGLTAGTPVLVGLVDTSSAMLLSGALPGQLLNNCGSTDVLALCMDRAMPDENLLTRAIGVGRRWMSVSTIAAAGSALQWVKEQLFRDLDGKAFWRLVGQLGGTNRSSKKSDTPATVHFDPYLAGERTSVEQRRAAFTELTLSTTREQMLAAVIDALAKASGARLDLFSQLGVQIRRRVMTTGGAKGGLGELFHRDWKGRWRFYEEKEATLRGLAKLQP